MRSPNPQRESQSALPTCSNRARRRNRPSTAELAQIGVCAVEYRSVGVMPSAADYREQAEALFRRARAEHGSESLALVMRAIELEAMADELERGQVQQSGTQPPTGPPRQQQAPQQQAQQQQQIQTPKEEGK